MELKMNKEAYEYVLTNEERESLRKEIIELLEEYDYHPTEEGVDKILDEWVKNKGWMINLFKKHPNYNGKYQIVFDTDYNRVCDKNSLIKFRDYLYKVGNFMLKEVQIGMFSYYETVNIYNRLNKIMGKMEDIYFDGYNPLVNGKSLNEIRREKSEWSKKLMAYKNKVYNNELVLSNDKSYDYESYKLFENIENFAYYIGEYTDNIATEYIVEKINNYFPSVKAVIGQKTSRIVGKVAKLSGIDKHPEWNREFAKYSDAINPLAIKRHTILSCHPIDYFTMSFGNSWASCHTIDKKNKRNMPNDYSGCYSSGTLSYMLDGSSFIFYTVDKEYNGNNYELQSKINRNMFHMGEDKLIQARVYPQATDGETGIYRQIREIAQKVISDCLGVPNIWKNVKGTGECRDMTYSYGTHYKDYYNFSDCNVSYLKNETDEINTYTINIGHDPICPSCGRVHYEEETIECDNCYKDNYTCYHCGRTAEDMHEIDGDYYCEDCCFYCEYHDEWETGDYTYIENYGRVCDDALNYSDNFIYCDNCCEWYYEDDDSVYTEDGNYYCSAECAANAGYTMLDNGDWYPNDEVYYCEHCNTYVLVDDWNSELECCIDCENEVRENESEAV